MTEDPELFGGLTRAEAVALCVKRAGELTHDQIRFIVKLSERRRGKLHEMASDEVVRLRTMVVDLLQRGSEHGDATSSPPGATVADETPNGSA